MAKQKIFEDGFGTVHPESYWKITELTINTFSHWARFTFSGFKDKIARDNNKQPLKKVNFVLSKDLFDIHYTTILNKLKNPIEIGYLICTQINSEDTLASGDPDGRFFDSNSLDVL